MIYYVEPLHPYRNRVVGVGALFRALRNGATWIERDRSGNDVRLAQRPRQDFPVWTPKKMEVAA